ncbi:MAG: PEP-CTERM sorting domain-containing protein [Caldimonas sp.]
MFKKSILAATLVAAALSSAHAVTVIGDATLSDTATVHATTVTPTGYLTYLSGSNGATGTADGSGFTSGGFSVADALATADHAWAQYDPTIFMTSGSFALSSLLAIPAIDHGWAPGNVGGEFFEPFEFKIWGCTAAVLSACTEGHITDVYTLGVDNAGPGKNADDWATVWAFDAAYTIFAITSGDRLVGGPFSAGEGEIDALAIVAIPEPSELMLMLAGLGAVGFMARRRRGQA